MLERVPGTLGMMVVLALTGCTSPRLAELQVEQVGDMAAFEQTLARVVDEDAGNGYDRSDGSIGPFVARRLVLGGNAPDLTVVYLAGQAWCGSGGCTLVVLQGEGASARLLSRTTVSYPPVRVMETRTNGLADLAVDIRNMDPARGPLFAVLRFDGTTYPLNPGMPPAIVLTEPPQGRVIISDDDIRDARAAAAPF
jgi:hypothetical protein